MDYGWYHTLNRPAFFLSSKVIEIAVLCANILISVVMARFITKRRFTPEMPLIFSTGVCDVLFILFFTSLKLIPVAAVILGIEFALTIAILVRLLLHDMPFAFVYLPVVALQSYLFISFICLALLN